MRRRKMTAPNATAEAATGATHMTLQMSFRLSVPANGAAMVVEVNADTKKDTRWTSL